MLEPVLVQLQKTYPQDVRLVFRHFPLKSIHANARMAAIAAEAAGKQDQFFAMQKILLEEQQVWGNLSDSDFRSWLKNAAADLDLDIELFTADLNSPELGKKIDAAYDAAVAAGIGGTPFVVVNGKPYQNQMDFAGFEMLVKLYKITERQFTQCPPMNINPVKKYTATLETPRGNIVLELFPDRAPVAVNSFIFLSQQGWYDDNPFYLVVPGSYVLTGDPTATNYGNPGYYYDSEISDLRFDKAGVVGMHNSGPNSNGSRFFITLSAQPKLDGTYTIFGQVVEGLDILKEFPAYSTEQEEDSGSAEKILRVIIQED